MQLGHIEARTDEERRGFEIHATVTAFVIALLIIINVVTTPEFPWSIFPLVGMSVGLATHYYFGLVLNGHTEAGA
jgi:hypothetical protein